MKTVNFKTLGPTTILIEWPKEISPEIHNELLAFRKLVKLFSNQILETVISYNAIGLFLKSGANAEHLIQQIKETISLDKIKPLKTGIIWQVPVCYEPAFSPDMELMRKQTGLTAKQLIQKHTLATYRIYFCGFLPGFIYLGGLDPALEAPRLKSPRKRVPKGAVGIAGLQTGIYPQESPGGWNLIGRCPLSIFNPNNDAKPSPFNAGQLLQFYAVKGKEFTKIEGEVAKGTYSLKFKQTND